MCYIEREENYRLTGELLCSEAKVNHKEVYMYAQFAEHTLKITLKIFYLATWDPSIALPGSQLTGQRFSYVTAKCVRCVYARISAN